MKSSTRAARSSSAYSHRNESIDSKEFDLNQLKQIQKGREAGVDVSEYADPKFTDSQMEKIKKRLQSRSSYHKEEK